MAFASLPGSPTRFPSSRPPFRPYNSQDTRDSRATLSRHSNLSEAYGGFGLDDDASRLASGEFSSTQHSSPHHHERPSASAESLSDHSVPASFAGPSTQPTAAWARAVELIPGILQVIDGINLNRGLRWLRWCQGGDRQARYLPFPLTRYDISYWSISDLGKLRDLLLEMSKYNKKKNGPYTEKLWDSLRTVIDVIQDRRPQEDSNRAPRNGGGDAFGSSRTFGSARGFPTSTRAQSASSIRTSSDFEEPSPRRRRPNIGHREHNRVPRLEAEVERLRAAVASMESHGLGHPRYAHANTLPETPVPPFRRRGGFASPVVSVDGIRPWEHHSYLHMQDGDMLGVPLHPLSDFTSPFAPIPHRPDVHRRFLRYLDGFGRSLDRVQQARVGYNWYYNEARRIGRAINAYMTDGASPLGLVEEYEAAKEGMRFWIRQENLTIDDFDGQIDRAFM